MTGRHWSLGARMVLVFGALVAAIGVFVLAFFPARMAAQAQDQAVERAMSIAQVMSSAVAPALEFDDRENAAQILAWLARARDARFGVLRGEDGEVFATWQAAAVPTDHVLGAVPVEITDDSMIVAMPVQGLGGGRGTLQLGFGLEMLAAERARARQTVAYASAAVLGVGLLVTLGLATLLVRPIRKLTKTARMIADGELPPELPTVEGGDEVARLADALRAMLDRIHERSQTELVRASRHAGMAEVATGVLHNVGNVLTSVNVSLELLRERTGSMPVERLKRLHALLGQSPSLDGEKLVATRRYLDAVSESFAAFREAASTDLATLGGHVEHIKRVVAMQNSYARVRSMVEPTRVGSLVEEAVELGCPPTQRGDIAISCEVASDITAAPVALDRHRVLQILVNLVSNARDAVKAAEGPRRIRVSARRDGTALVVAVTDSGVGIAPELRSRIFSAGYTSKAHGHGYGLHSSALAARQLGGSLDVASAGTGQGATFTLTIPLEDVTS